MSKETYIEETPDGKFTYDIHSLEGGLVKMLSEGLEEDIKHWKEILEVDSLDIMDLGRALIIGGLTEALGDEYLHYLKEKRGFPPEIIEESLETYAKCFEYTKKHSSKEDKFIRGDLVRMGHLYVNAFNFDSPFGQRYWLEEVATGEIKVDVTKW